MEWNEYQAYHKKMYGVSTKAEISRDYKTYKRESNRARRTRSAGTRMTPKKNNKNNNLSPHRLTGQRAMNLKKILKNLPDSRIRQTEELKKILNNADKGRGSPTRGWGAASPQRGTERNQLMNKCGPDAFLDPINKKFPIMPALRSTSGRCEVSCQGVGAARNRACQYKRINIANKAKKIGIEQCGWDKNIPACRYNEPLD